MGLAETISAAATAIFAGLGNLKQSYTYLSDPTSGGSYDPATGTVTQGGTSHTVSCVKYDYESNEVDGQKILATDQRLIFLAASVTFTPKIGDLVSIDSAQWQVVNKTQDPAGVIWDIQIRRP